MFLTLTAFFSTHSRSCPFTSAYMASIYTETGANIVPIGLASVIESFSKASAEFSGYFLNGSLFDVWHNNVNSYLPDSFK